MTATQARTEPFLFAVDGDRARARRTADVFELVMTSIVAVIAGWVHRAGSGELTPLLTADLPAWLDTLGSAAFIGAIVAAVAVALAIIGNINHHPLLTRDLLVGLVFAALICIVGARWSADTWPRLFASIGTLAPPTPYPVTDLVFITAVFGVAGPYLTQPVRRAGRVVVGVAATIAVLMRYGSVSSVIGGIAVGMAVSALVHVIMGSTTGIPSVDRVSAALARGQVPVDGLVYVDRQPIGATLLTGTTTADGPVLVKVYGRDASDAALAGRLWRRMWYRHNDHSPALTASRMQLVEHEALLLLDGTRAGAAVPQLVGWGRGDAGDAFLVIATGDATSLRELGTSSLDDAELERLATAAWRAVARLHGAGFVHRSLTLDTILATSDGVVLDDLSTARVTRDDDERALDRAQMLVALAIVCGVQRAVEVARVVIGEDAAAAAVALMQGLVLPSTSQSDLRHHDLTLRSLRRSAADILGIEAPHAVQIARWSWGSALMGLISIVAFTTAISSLSKVDLGALGTELADAKPAWLLAAFIIAQLTNVGEWYTLTGLVSGTVPFVPTIQFRYALSFVGLAVPGDAGAIAMNIRYMQKLGVSTAAAAAQGPLATIVTKLIDLLAVGVTINAVRNDLPVGGIDFGPVGRLLGVAAIAGVTGLAAIAVIRPLRVKVAPFVAEAFKALRDVLTDPTRVFRVILGTLGQRLLFAIALMLSGQALGADLGLAPAILVNSAVSVFVGLVPVPGGIGVAEASLAAGLVAVGVPQQTALATAILHRIITTYLPTLYGWFASRWLHHRDYL